MSDFNAKRARAKRPFPLWVDAFQRDTQHLAADEVGAYLLVLMAMWVRETCDFPNDDRRLAAVSRVSPRLWKSRIGPAVKEFLKAQNGVLISPRLRHEADFVERHCKAQSDRKSDKKTDNPLGNNNPLSTTDMTADATADMSTDQPTQLPKNPTNTIPDGMDGNAVDTTDVVWSKCKDWLVSQGVHDPQARSVIGKWLKGSSASEVRAAFLEAQHAKTRNPIPYITAILNKPVQPTTAELMAMAKEVNAKR
ncbi:YdaU family protein [Ruegeria pomeroyi]|nr:YdaU family protein [Ruegeria pomeroyi]